MTLNRDKLAEAMAVVAKQPADIGWRAWAPYADAVLTEIHAQGYCIVPVEPSKEMLDAGMTAADDALDSDWESDADGGTHSYSYLRSDAPGQIYTAMISQGRER